MADAHTPAPAPRSAFVLRVYLTGRPAGCVAGTDVSAKRGIQFPARDTAGLFPDGFTAVWIGEDAIKFLSDHQAELKPGRCVDIEIYIVRALDHQLRMRVSSCVLAPLAPSWIAHEEKLRAQPTQENQTV
jgi:hypothetical protein